MKLRRRKKHEMEPEIELDEDAVVSAGLYLLHFEKALKQVDASQHSTWRHSKTLKVLLMSTLQWTVLVKPLNRNSIAS